MPIEVFPAKFHDVCNFLLNDSEKKACEKQSKGSKIWAIDV